MSECDWISGCNWNYLNIPLKDGLQMDRHLLKTADELLKALDDRRSHQLKVRGINRNTHTTLFFHKNNFIRIPPKINII